MLGVGIRLQDVLALDVNPLERAVDRGVEHIVDAQARLRIELHAPRVLEHHAHGIVGDVPIAGELVRERAHVAGALHVVVAAQRVDADTGAAKVARHHGEVGNGHHRRGALAVLGDAKAVIDFGIAARRIEARGRTQFRSVDAGIFRDGFRRVAFLGDEGGPFAEIFELAAFAHERLVHETFGDDHMRHRGRHCHVGAGQEGQVMLCGDVRGAAITPWVALSALGPVN